MKLYYLLLIIMLFPCLETMAGGGPLPFEKIISTPLPQRCDEMLLVLEAATDKNYIGESISQLAHALQCAQLAVESGADNETIIAALFHDIGHLCADNDPEAKRNDYGVMNHDTIGADFLRQCGLSEKVCQLVLGHVQAKRYLTSIDPDYRNRLSSASQATLIAQGEAMSPDEAAAFEQDPLFEAKIQIRSWDEAAKVVDLAVPDLSHYRQLLLETF